MPQDRHRAPGPPYSMFRYNAHLRKQRPSSPPILGGEETYWEGRRDDSSPPVLKSAMRRAQALAPGRAGRRTSAARLRTGGEEESPRTGDSNPGCNCLVRGYSPSMHFFWGGDMPRYSPPLPFRGAERGPSARGDPDVRGTVEDGRGGGIPPNGGFQSRL